MPEGKTASYNFDSYNSKLTLDTATHALIVIASLEISQTMIKAADYQQLSVFYKTV